MITEKEDDLFDDEVFERYKTKRIAELIKEIPELSTEEDLIKLTQYETMIVHFYDKTFETCNIMNKELNKIYRDFDNIKFYKIPASLCPVVTNKLNIKVLPFLGFFKGGYFVDQIIGFEEMGDKKFEPVKLKKRIQDSNIFK